MIYYTLYNIILYIIIHSIIIYYIAKYYIYKYIVSILCGWCHCIYYVAKRVFIRAVSSGIKLWQFFNQLVHQLLKIISFQST